MHADAQHQPAPVERGLTIDAVEHRERQPADGDRTIAPAAVEAGGRHVAVADGLDLLDAVTLAKLVEGAHQPVQEIHDVIRRQVVRRVGEIDEIGEHHAQGLDPVGDALFLAGFEPLRDR